MRNFTIIPVIIFLAACTTQPKTSGYLPEGVTAWRWKGGIKEMVLISKDGRVLPPVIKLQTGEPDRPDLWVLRSDIPQLTGWTVLESEDTSSLYVRVKK